MRQPSEQQGAALLADIRRIWELQGKKRWVVAQSNAAERRARLKRLAAAVEKHRAAINLAVQKDFGKAPEETDLTEVHIVLEELAHTLRNLADWMRPEAVDAPLLLAGTSSEVRHEARGQVLVLAPFNYPFHLAVLPVVSAVAAGNVVVLKPSEKTPATAAVIRSVLTEAFPEDEVAVIDGDAQVAEALLEMPWDHIFFTGSTAVGKKVMAAAAKHLSGVTLELGGKSPAVVERSANLGRTALTIAHGKFINGGQTCVAPDYVLVPEELRDKLVAELRNVVQGFYGQDAKASPDFCRMIDDRAFGRLKGYLEGAVKGGAKVAFGGESDAATRYVAPTVLVDVPVDAAVMQDEIFGPLLPVLTYKTPQEAVDFVRARPAPLALYVFAGSRREADRVLDGTASGGACVNTTIFHLANPDLPFGGIGPSGLGSYHGRAGFRCFSHERSVLRQRGSPLSRFLTPPYAGRMNRLTARLARWLE
ncbi:MAG: aldehyde dehydrogenase family protein [Myxococcaceae bacterium]